MSGKPRPKGRVFQPKAGIVGTQANRLVIGIFIGIWSFGGGLAYWIVNYRREAIDRFDKWLHTDSELVNDREYQRTQEALRIIREEKRLAQDPYYRDSLPKKGASSNKEDSAVEKPTSPKKE